MIQVNNISKKYKEFIALNNVSFNVNDGDIFGFIGCNGAGKTTLMRIIAMLMKPTSGKVIINNTDVIPGNYRELKNSIGFMPQNIRLNENIYPNELIELICKLRKCSSKRYIDLYKEIRGVNNKKLKHLSPGNQKKIQIILALIGNPQIIILDEPTAGLDPIGVNDFYNILKELKTQSCTLFISSHNLKELSGLCNTIAIIDNGEILYSGECKDAYEIETENNLIDDKQKYGIINNKFKEINIKIKIENNIITTYSDKTKIPEVLELLRSEDINVFGVKERGLDTLYEEIINK